MQIDPVNCSPADTYKLITNLVIPRPIAWVTSLDRQGAINLAPFSFFNAVGAQPPYLIISVGPGDAGRQKDTAANIQASAEFVVNMVTEELFEPMNLSAADFPAGESELVACGLTAAPSVHVAVPRVAEAPVSFECRLHSTQTLGSNTLIIGQVLMFHVADALIDERLRIHDFAPIGRMGSPSVYCRTVDRFDRPRISYALWRAGRGPA